MKAFCLFGLLVMTLSFCGLSGIFVMSMQEEMRTGRPVESISLAGLESTSLGSVLLATFVITSYFTPALIAGGRSHQNTLAIFMLNLFLGWSFLGWVVALIWSCTSVKRGTI